MGRRSAGEGSPRKRKDGRWQVSRSIGPRGAAKRLYGYGPTRKAAFTDLESKVDRHTRRLTLEEAADWVLAQYLDWWTGEELPARVADGTLASTSREAYTGIVRNHLRDTALARSTRLDALGATHVRRLLADAAAAGKTTATRERMHAVLVVALSTAVDYELIAGNPASRVRAPAPRRERDEGVSIEHARALLAAAGGRRYEGLWRLLLGVPLRPGEPLGADAADFDLDAGVYRVRWNLQRAPRPDGAVDHRGRRRHRWERHDTKTHVVRDVPLTGEVVEALRGQLERRDLERSWAGDRWSEPEVFLATGEPVATDLVFRLPDGRPAWHPDVEAELTAMCADAEVPRLTPHRLRHAAVTLLLESGVHPAVVQQLAGHGSAAMTDRYTDALEAAKREAVETLARRLRS